ncbi:transposable element Tcb1 transposase [Trichonephila clavipes]|nr:transposable element Tcb1 transposase [Trichonephila clavipes]
MAVTDHSVTSRTIAQHIESVTHHTVSARTIRRRLQQSGLSSRICLQHRDGRIRVWRHRGERMLNSCVMHRHTGPAPGIMIESLPWSAGSPDLSPMEYMWSTVAQRFTQITPPAATPAQLWQRVEASWSVVPQEHIQSLFVSMPRRMAGSPTMVFYSGY